MDFKRLTKTVKVTDPECWYGRDTVDVSLVVTPVVNGTVAVRIVVSSIDDFMVAYERECYALHEDAVKWKYDHLKRWMYDKIPEEINLDWLYEHGYLPY